MKDRVKLVVAKNMLPPYRVEFLRRLGTHCDLTLLLDTLSEGGRGWEVGSGCEEFECRLLGSPSVAYRYKGADRDLSEERFAQFPLKILPVLEEIRPECVVSAELGFRSVLAALWCFWRKAPLVIWWEGTPHTERGTGRGRRAVRRFLAKRASRFWSNGAESEEYLASLGVPRERIDNGMTGVDCDFFVRGAARARAERDRLRGEVGVRGRAILYSGSLSARKGIGELLRAMEDPALRTVASDLTLIFVGEGELRDTIANWRRRNGWVKVVLTGFVQTGRLPELYAISDLFVLPTIEDNWALATLEPLLCGVPSLISRYNGAASDLVPGEGADWAQVVDPKNPREFAAALVHQLGKLPRTVPEHEVRRLAEYYHPARQARRAFESVQAAVAGARRAAGFDEGEK